MNRLVSSETDLGIVDLAPDRARFLREVLDGLALPDKRLPTQYLYDERGSELFEQICELPEYYPTRTELAIFEASIHEMAAQIGPETFVIEYGSGAGIKPRILLRALERPVAYAPVDISRAHLMRSAEELAVEFPDVEVLPVCADFTEPFAVPTPRRKARRSVVFFPGSTIGNFGPENSIRLLSQLRDEVGARGCMLVGVDLHKPIDVLVAAYNDQRGVTAEFNLNLLRRINRELDADFDVDAFTHRAIYDREHGRIAMRLEAVRPQIVRVAAREFHVSKGEAITTEYSYKFTLEGFAALCRRASVDVARVWTDERRYFSVHLLNVK